MSTRDKWIRRFTVDETEKHKNGFTIYKITSILFPLQSPEAVTSVSVWKRYSDVQRLHKSMRSLHAGLHLRGTFPELPKHSYFKRFQQEVIDERSKTIKLLLEFIAEHKLLFTSTDFVNFLQTGYPKPDKKPSGVIDSIRTSLHLPIEESPPLEYQTDDEERSPADTARPPEQLPMSIDETDFISQIPIYEAADVEIRHSPKPTKSNSFDSLSSIESIDSDLYDELSKLSIDKSRPSIRKLLPDLINFDVPSTSKFEDYHTMPRLDSETTSLNSNLESTSMSELERSSSLSLYSKRSALSLSNAERLDSKTRTEDSYVFEAGYLLNLAARYEDMGEYQRAFEAYKSGIEKMLVGVQTDSDPQRRALIKEKTNKYLSYAEEIYNNHLNDTEQSLISEPVENPARYSIPLCMVARGAAELARYSVLGVLGARLMLVVRQPDSNCYAMKVIQKVPNNLTEFDEYFLQRTSETRTPILPTIIPYMVPLHAYIETNNLIFLILSYAPGEKLFNYIKNYAKSLPATPSREVNLENVFTEPKYKDFENNVDVGNRNDVGNSNVDDVHDIVLKSQKLLSNVDRVLTENFVDNVVETPAVVMTNSIKPKDALPPSAITKWGAEILTALESLHNCGVICRDLNPSNILLGHRGQVILTYFTCLPLETQLSSLLARTDLYVAPETCLVGSVDSVTCDFWSFGAIMYELLCGMPLTDYHRTPFTSHTILELPEGLPVEVESLLTQLLTYDPAERLGSGPDGIEEIKRHPYFKNIDWQQVYDSWIVPD